VIKTRIVIASLPLNLGVETPFHRRFSATFGRPPDAYGRARDFTCGRQHFTKGCGEETDEMPHLNAFLHRVRGRTRAVPRIAGEEP
jgi:hypothetical protein